MPVHHSLGRHYIVNPGDVIGVIHDRLVDDRLIDVGDPGDINRPRALVIVAGAVSLPAIKSRRVIVRLGIVLVILRLREKYRHI